MIRVFPRWEEGSTNKGLSSAGNAAHFSVPGSGRSWRASIAVRFPREFTIKLARAMPIPHMPITSVTCCLLPPYLPLNTMSYQALLFCPDEKTARVVTQVLSELEFTVEPCHEPFAAVKKLMVQHFDALVVDCDNEQNAALLFKSARNSGSNQASLAVAVVEGQTGVAKAFRLGANLVLTKPIHVEQSKGTLRVARGLLRKGQAAKPVVAGAPNATPASLPQPSIPAPFPPQQSFATPPSASASAFELDAEPSPQPDVVDAALLEYMPDSPRAGSEDTTQAAAESDPSKQYPWQPRKPMAEPMASALRRAAEAAGKSEFDAAAPRPAGAQSGTPQASSHGKSGAAAAPARAKEIPAPDAKSLALEPTASAISAPSLSTLLKQREKKISARQKILQPVRTGMRARAWLPLQRPALVRSMMASKRPVAAARRPFWSLSC